jgi:hypothetical protein
MVAREGAPGKPSIEAQFTCLQRDGSAQWTSQWPPGQSTSHPAVHVTSQEDAPSQCTMLPSPTVAVQRCFTY